MMVSPHTLQGRKATCSSRTWTYRYTNKSITSQNSHSLVGLQVTFMVRVMRGFCGSHSLSACLPVCLSLSRHALDLRRSQSRPHAWLRLPARQGLLPPTAPTAPTVIQLRLIKQQHLFNSPPPPPSPCHPHPPHPPVNLFSPLPPPHNPSSFVSLDQTIPFFPSINPFPPTQVGKTAPAFFRHPPSLDSHFGPGVLSQQPSISAAIPIPPPPLSGVSSTNHQNNRWKPPNLQARKSAPGVSGPPPATDPFPRLLRRPGLRINSLRIQPTVAILAIISSSLISTIKGPSRHPDFFPRLLRCANIR